jgi:integrase
MRNTCETNKNLLNGKYQKTINEEINMTENFNIKQDFSSFVSVQRWHRQLRKKSADIDTDIPPDTLKHCNRAIRLYCKYTGLNPDEIISDVESELRRSGNMRKHNDMLDAFWDDYPSKTTAGILFSDIKSFYRHNGVPLTTKTPAIPKVRKHKFDLTTPMIRAICDKANSDHKSWILADNYMGMRIGGVTALTVEDFHTENWEKDRPIYPVFVGRHISGTFNHYTFIGHDAMITLRNYIAANHLQKCDNLWRMDESHMNDMFKKYAYEAGVISAPKGLWPNGIPKGLSLLHSHTLRKRLETVMERAKIEPNWRDQILGHIPKATADAFNYSEPNLTDLYNAYLTALPELEVYAHHVDSPTPPNVELKKIFALQNLRDAGVEPQKLKQIENMMKMFRRVDEVEQAVQAALLQAH